MGRKGLSNLMPSKIRRHRWPSIRDSPQKQQRSTASCAPSLFLHSAHNQSNNTITPIIYLPTERISGIQSRCIMHLFTLIVAIVLYVSAVSTSAVNADTAAAVPINRRNNDDQWTNSNLRFRIIKEKKIRDKVSLRYRAVF